MSTSERKVILITGVSSGIGYATALAFARRGYHVAGTARRAEKLEALQAAVAALNTGVELLPLAVDVRDGDAMQAAVAQIMARFGRLDGLVANAGIGQRGALVEADWQDLDAVLRTNIDGVYHSVRAAVPAIRAGGRGGQIVLISSIMFNMTAPYAATYAASKAFVSSLARSLRFELAGDRIGVSDLRVGRTVTEFNDKRLGNPGRSGGRLPQMTADQVAAGIVRAVERGQSAVTLRWLDRLIVLANRLVPGIIGALAARQYR